MEGNKEKQYWAIENKLQLNRVIRRGKGEEDGKEKFE